LAGRFSRDEGKRRLTDLDPFYPIVESAAWVERIIAAGARLIQLRIKDRADAEVRADIRAALAVCARADAQLIVNDYWEMAIDEGADFIHLGQGDLDDADMKRIRGRGLRVGVSTHDHAELDRALSFDPDYVALGPIYPTILKAMPFAPQGLGRIGEWKRLIGERPLVAIGGINLERAPLCLAEGADSAAVVTDITLNADPDGRAKAWLAATRRAA
jgi:thiamine-phosphate pyrophosphorylase